MSERCLNVFACSKNRYRVDIHLFLYIRYGIGKVIIFSRWHGSLPSKNYSFRKKPLSRFSLPISLFSFSHHVKGSIYRILLSIVPGGIATSVMLVQGSLPLCIPQDSAISPIIQFLLFWDGNLLSPLIRG